MISARTLCVICSNRALRSSPLRSPPYICLNRYMIHNKLRRSGPIHDDADAHETQNSSDNIRAVRHVFVKDPAPNQGQNDKNSAVSSIDPSKMAMLQSGIHVVDHLWCVFYRVRGRRQFAALARAASARQQRMGVDADFQLWRSLQTDHLVGHS